jgi:hypothetical protein
MESGKTATIAPQRADQEQLRDLPLALSGGAINA